MKVLLN